MRQITIASRPRAAYECADAERRRDLTSSEESRLRNAATPSLALGLICLLLHLADQRPLPHFPRRALFHRLRPASGAGIRRSAAAHPADRGRPSCAVRRQRLAAPSRSGAGDGGDDRARRRISRLLGGGRFAQWLCGLAVLCAPVLLVDGLLLTTDCLQPLTWLACAWCLTRVAQTRDERWWLGFGLAAGISLAAKYLICSFWLSGGRRPGDAAQALARRGHGSIWAR